MSPITALSLLLSLPVHADPDYDALLAEQPDLSTRDYLRQLPAPDYRDGVDFPVEKAKDYKLVADALKLTREERALLSSNGFVLVDHEQRYTFGSAYYGIYAQDLPVLVTTDSILHAMHRSFDDILMRLEGAALLPTMEQVLALSHETLVAEAGPMDKVPAHVRDVDLYLTVARNLAAGAGAPAGPAGYGEESWDGALLAQSAFGQDEDVLVVLRQIQALEMQTPGTEVSTLFGAERMIDYTQFRPRGHYNKGTALKRYFRTMMWLGRADTGFELEHPRQVAGAALLSAVLERSGTEVDLAEMDTLIAWLVGESDNLGPRAVLDTMDELGISAAELADPEVQRTLQQHLEGAQRIRSQVVVSNRNDLVQVKPPELFQLFGQRFVLDSFVLSKVVFDSIITDGQKVERMMPSGLDVAAALGNSEAGRLLAPELEQHPYAQNLWAASRWVSALPEATWSQSVYNTWLDTLRVLDDDVTGTENMPQAMQTAAWQRKMLQTQLASWAELRHDTILYAKQSYTAYPSCEYPAGYVEPYPEVYAGVRRFSEATEAALGAVRFPHSPDPGALRDLLSGQRTFLRAMAETMDTLEKLARKELAGDRFTVSETAFLKKTIDIRGGGSGPPTYDGWYPGLFYGGGGSAATKWSPEVADVHTDPASGSVLEVGTGDVDFIVMAVDNEGDTRVFVGPTYSYYEFTWPASDRLTDEKWSGLLHQGGAPERPAWIGPVIGAPQERRLR